MYIRLQAGSGAGAEAEKPLEGLNARLGFLAAAAEAQPAAALQAAQLEVPAPGMVCSESQILVGLNQKTWAVLSTASEGKYRE